MTRGQETSEQQVGGPPHFQALLVAFAMVARGEIGFLIASLAQSSGTLAVMVDGAVQTGFGQEDVFLVIIWAVVLCTIVGPIAVGILVRRSSISVINHG